MNKYISKYSFINLIELTIFFLLSVCIYSCSTSNTTLVSNSQRKPAHAIAIAGNYAYVADVDGLTILDISDIAKPVKAGTYPIKRIPNEVKVKDHYALVAYHYGLLESCGTLEIIDVSDVKKPFQVATLDSVYCEATAISNNYAFLVGGNRLQVIDISNPTKPIELGYCDLTSDGKKIALYKNYAFVAEGKAGVGIYDVSDLRKPSYLSYVRYNLSSPSGSEGAYGIAMIESTAYVAFGSLGLKIFDVSDPSRWLQLGDYADLANYKDIVVGGSFAYVLCDWGWTAGLKIFDISKPRYPTKVANYETELGLTKSDITIKDNYVFIAGKEGILIIRNDYVTKNP